MHYESDHGWDDSGAVLGMRQRGKGNAKSYTFCLKAYLFLLVT